MEALFRWLVASEVNYSVVIYTGAAVFSLAMLGIYFYIRGDDRS